MNQTPPQFEPKRNTNRKMIIYGVCIVLLSGVFGFAGASLANSIHGKNSGGIHITQQTGNTGQSTITDVSDVAKKCGPSVVEITTESVSSGNDFFGQYVQQGAGSGVIIDENGYIVTNNHVIEGASSIIVRTNDGSEYPAQLIGTDPQTDLAVIKVEASNLTPATFGDSDALEVGDAVIAIGNPLGELGGSVSSGIISAKDREIQVENETMTLLQTDAAINPGNSGGGLFDANGNLIGIVNAKQSSTGIEGLGFAIPISNSIDIINELIENGSITSRPALNLSLTDYVASNNPFSKSNLEDGCYIVQIVEGGAADLAGLQINDRILTFDDKAIQSSSEVKAILRNHKIGDKVKMVIQRDNHEIEVDITLQASSLAQ